MLEALPALREVYCGTIAYEIEHISDHAERVWLRQAIESGRYRQPLSVEERVRLLDRVSRAEGFEQYLRRAFLGQKQFSLEGLDTMVPMLDEAIEIAAAAGAHEVVVGMAHRGRLNVLVHTVGRSYESILREFEGERTIDAVVTNDEGGTGDVKYHLAATGTRATASGEVTVTLAPNPSHLEAVDPVVEGWTRAEQTDRSFGAGIHDPSVALPILIHGDASFAGQGVVAETLNLSNLDGYSTGGTLHLIANNQVGFTTDPAEGRSTRYSSDLAKGFDIPIVHVNADDPEAAISAVRLAMAYRQEFGHDIVVDLIGYRRFGHNEQDEAAYTQPLMVAQIAAHPTVHELYAAQLVEEGVVSAEQAAAVFDEVQAELRAAHDRLKASIAVPRPIKEGRIPADTGEAVVTAVAAERLEELNEQLLEVPEGFEGNAKLLKQLERRREAFREGGIDWGQAEALALGSLLTEGIPIRLSGQDTERGTFSHRHAMLHDQRTGETHASIQHLPDAAAVDRDLQLAAVRIRVPRLRVRLRSCGSRRARDLGGAVRRLRQRRPDRRRPVPRRRAVQVGADGAADAAPTARVRGERPRALEREARALPPARRAGEHPDRELHDRGAALPPSAQAGARRDRPSARRDDAQGAPAPEAGRLDARRSQRRPLRARVGRSACRRDWTGRR